MVPVRVVMMHGLAMMHRSVMMLRLVVMVVPRHLIMMVPVMHRMVVRMPRPVMDMRRTVIAHIDEAVARRS